MDREKVVERIHEAIDMGVCVDLFMDVLELLKEQEAAYQGAVELLREKTILFDDAIKRLKEQEAVEPIAMQRMDDNFSFFVPYFLCGNCRYELVGKDVMFCSHCGRKVKWE